MQKKLLVTGFDPFDGADINPAWEAVKLLPDRIGEWEIDKLMIPTVFGAAPKAVISKPLRSAQTPSSRWVRREAARR